MNEEIARILLEKRAVTLNAKDPFTYVSGIRSPIYCDNRQMIAYTLKKGSRLLMPLSMNLRTMILILSRGHQPQGYRGRHG